MHMLYASRQNDEIKSINSPPFLYRSRGGSFMIVSYLFIWVNVCSDILIGIL